MHVGGGKQLGGEERREEKEAKELDGNGRYQEAGRSEGKSNWAFCLLASLWRQVEASQRVPCGLLQAVLCAGGSRLLISKLGTCKRLQAVFTLLKNSAGQ